MTVLTQMPGQEAAQRVDDGGCHVLRSGEGFS
jgi:hypothetical protein